MSFIHPRRNIPSGRPAASAGQQHAGTGSAVARMGRGDLTRAVRGRLRVRADATERLRKPHFDAHQRTNQIDLVSCADVLTDPRQDGLHLLWSKTHSHKGVGGSTLRLSTIVTDWAGLVRILSQPGTIGATGIYQMAVVVSPGSSAIEHGKAPSGGVVRPSLLRSSATNERWRRGNAMAACVSAHIFPCTG
jgi:hypothetical protein